MLYKEAAVPAEKEIDAVWSIPRFCMGSVPTGAHGLRKLVCLRTSYRCHTALTFLTATFEQVQNKDEKSKDS